MASEFSGGIVLYAKRPGMTSFSSLGAVKKALGTKKVGHTGTLDSFASGLLVVCAGSLTRLAGKITAFDKEYEAVLALGAETDTLEPSGRIIRTAPLPSEKDFESSVGKFIGQIMQAPPAYSALHVNGVRASDIARSGGNPELAERPVTVRSAQILEKRLDSFGRVEFARVRFLVSKGTYIRCLARDIASDCGSAAHLAGLRRTGVGCFRLEDAAGFSALAPFCIDSVLQNLKDSADLEGAGEKFPQELLEEIRALTRPLDAQTASVCGCLPVYIAREFAEGWKNGRPLSRKCFLPSDANFRGRMLAAFAPDGSFAGCCSCAEDGRLSYDFVVH